MDVRGVPKFGIQGRFGLGKTHNLFHLKYILEQPESPFRSKAFYVRMSPYTEEDPSTRGWVYIHKKILDALGEHFLRELVRAADRQGARQEELSDALEKQLKFGDANLRQSLAYVLANYFLREGRETGEAWAWLKGQGTCQGTTKVPETSSDMIYILLNIGTLSRWALQTPIVLLFDEGQALGEVRKASISQVHDSFLQLAERDNTDVGFVLAVFGTGAGILPPVIMEPPDIISRLGVTERDLYRALIDLKDVIRTKDELRQFANDVLTNLVDSRQAGAMISAHNLQGVTPQTLPFTADGLERIAEVVFGREDNRNPRKVIEVLAGLASNAYQEAKPRNQYILVDRSFADPLLRTL
jgi:hypothetical protein